MRMVLLQLVLNEYREEEGSNEADTLGYSYLPGCSFRLPIIIYIRRLIQTHYLNIEGNSDLLRHNRNPGAHKVKARHIKVAPPKPETKRSLILCVSCSLRLFLVKLVYLKNACLLRVNVTG